MTELTTLRVAVDGGVAPVTLDRALGIRPRHDG